MSIRVASVVLCVLLANPAHAGWQQTEWGMTRAEVEARIPSERAVAPSGAAFALPWAVQEMRTLVSFYFNQAGKLAEVDVLPDLKDCDSISALLTLLYGTPEVDSQRGLTQSLTRRWRDREHGNMVEFHRNPEVCRVIYRPVMNPNSHIGL